MKASTKALYTNIGPIVFYYNNNNKFQNLYNKITSKITDFFRFIFLTLCNFKIPGSEVAKNLG